MREFLRRLSRNEDNYTILYCTHQFRSVLWIRWLTSENAVSTIDATVSAVQIAFGDVLQVCCITFQIVSVVQNNS